MDSTQADRAEAQLRAGVYARLSETYDAAESVPTQIERGTGHATRRGWAVTATFKDDGFSGFKEITRDGFGELIAAIQAGAEDTRSQAQRFHDGLQEAMRPLCFCIMMDSWTAHRQTGRKPSSGRAYTPA